MSSTRGQGKFATQALVPPKKSHNGPCELRWLGLEANLKSKETQRVLKNLSKWIFANILHFMWEKRVHHYKALRQFSKIHHRPVAYFLRVNKAGLSYKSYKSWACYDSVRSKIAFAVDGISLDHGSTLWPATSHPRSPTPWKLRWTVFLKKKTIEKQTGWNELTQLTQVWIYKMCIY